MPSVAAATIDDYIAAFPVPVRSRLVRVRRTIRRAAPKALEKIAYRIPTYTLHGYRTTKGAIQFPHDEPLPHGLIERIVKYCVKGSGKRR